MVGRGGSRSGQGLVEFALVLPLFLFLIIGMVEFGRAWMTRNIITGAAREAVRIAAVGPPLGGVALATARANAILDSANLTGVRTVTIADDGVAFGTVTVTVAYQFNWIFSGVLPSTQGTTLRTPGADASGIPLTSTTTMRKEF